MQLNHRAKVLLRRLGMQLTIAWSYPRLDIVMYGVQVYGLAISDATKKSEQRPSALEEHRSEDNIATSELLSQVLSIVLCSSRPLCTSERTRGSYTVKLYPVRTARVHYIRICPWTRVLQIHGSTAR